MSYSWDIIGKRIETERKQKGITQEELAEKVGNITGHNALKRQTVAGWENGTPIKKIEQLTALCEVFECDISYLLCEYDCKRVASVEISKITGLSEMAIDTLIWYQHNKEPKNFSDIINALIMSPDLLESIFEHCYYCPGQKQYLHPEQSIAEMTSGDPCIIYTMSKNDLEQFKVFRVYNAINKFMQKFINSDI